LVRGGTLCCYTYIRF